MGPKFLAWAQLGPTHLGPAWAQPLGPGFGPPTWAQRGPTHLGPSGGPHGWALGWAHHKLGKLGVAVRNKASCMAARPMPCKAYNIYTGTQISPPNAGYLGPHKCHLVFLWPCFPCGFLLEPCQIVELQKCHLVFHPLAGQIGELQKRYLLVFPTRLARFCPLGIEVEKQGFRTAWLIKGQKFREFG